MFDAIEKDCYEAMSTDCTLRNIYVDKVNQALLYMNTNGEDCRRLAMWSFLYSLRLRTDYSILHGSFPSFFAEMQLRPFHPIILYNNWSKLQVSLLTNTKNIRPLRQAVHHRWKKTISCIIDTSQTVPADICIVTAHFMKPSRFTIPISQFFQTVEDKINKFIICQMAKMRIHRYSNILSSYLVRDMQLLICEYLPR
jgi:hypothetical protein